MRSKSNTVRSDHKHKSQVADDGNGGRDRAGLIVTDLFAFLPNGKLHTVFGKVFQDSRELEWAGYTGRTILWKREKETHTDKHWQGAQQSDAGGDRNEVASLSRDTHVTAMLFIAHLAHVYSMPRPRNATSTSWVGYIVDCWFCGVVPPQWTQRPAGMRHVSTWPGHAWEKRERANISAKQKVYIRHELVLWFLSGLHFRSLSLSECYIPDEVCCGVLDMKWLAVQL